MVRCVRIGGAGGNVRARRSPHRLLLRRRALELAVSWAYMHDATLHLPYQGNLSALIHEPTFKQTAGEAVFSKARVINTLGNRAVHSHRPVPETDAVAAVRELFHVAYWLARTYSRAERARLAFNPAALPKPGAAARQTAEQLQRLEAEMRERDEKLAALLADKTARATEESQGLGLFVRSLVGLDRGAAKEAMAEFLAGKTLSANQIEFVNLIVDHLTEHGVVEPGRLYESPFTHLTPTGPDSLFTAAQLDQLLRSLAEVRARAVAA